VFLSTLALVVSLIPTSSPASVSGTVVDPSGRPVPRAFVQIVTRDGAAAATVLTDAEGTFRFADAPDACRVRVSLTGFQEAVADCSTTPLRVALGVAPIAEDIVVSPTRTEAPAGQVAAAITVFVPSGNVPPLSGRQVGVSGPSSASVALTRPE